MEQRSTACPLDCPDLCGLTVTVDNERVVELTGDRRGPITDGIICGKVRKFTDHMYGAARLQTPIVRVGAKGSGAWKAVSWDEALALIADRFHTIRARSGAEAIVPYHYGGSNGWLTEGALATRFFRRLGASNLDRTFCASATTRATHGLYGVMPGVPLEDFAHSKLIVLWGNNPTATGIHLVPIIDRAREAGAKLVVVDPRTTQLAKRADLHLPLRPGTDLPVALALGNALLARGHGDDRFLAEHTTGLHEYVARASEWSLERAADEAGIDASLLDSFIELYASTNPAVIRAGWGIERNRNGGSAVAAVLALPALAGKFGVRGGGYTLGNHDARWGVTSEGGIAEPATKSRSINMSLISTALRELRDPKIEALFVYNCNPAVTAPDQAALVEELHRDDLFVVVHDQVMTDTAHLADVVLPATTFLEHRELRRGYGVMRMFDSHPVVAPVGEARSNNALFADLLKRMDLVRPGEDLSEDAIVAQIFRAHPEGERLQHELAEHTIATPSVGTNPVAFVDVFPGTPDQKVHLFDDGLDADAAPFGGLYAYKPDPRTLTYPLALISPALATQISSTFGQLRDKPAELELSPTDAAARHISTGDLIRVFNDRGEVHCVAKVTPETRPGVVVLPKGLWRKHTANGFTSNALIPPAVADLGGQAAFNDARVDVAKR